MCDNGNKVMLNPTQYDVSNLKTRKPSLIASRVKTFMPSIMLALSMLNVLKLLMMMLDCGIED